jgi:glycosyltransferase involved in cell wall biosynthesis
VIDEDEAILPQSAASLGGTAVALSMGAMSGESILSVVVPLFNERQNVEPLVAAVRLALESVGPWELVLVDDGSSDGTADVAGELAAADGRVRLVRLARNYGQTSAMQAGFDFARGSVVVSMDGDLQNDPEDIPALVAKLHEGFDLVTGYRVRRQDRLLTRKVPSSLFVTMGARLKPTGASCSTVCISTRTCTVSSRPWLPRRPARGSPRFPCVIIHGEWVRANTDYRRFQPYWRTYSQSK